jgi:PAS domain S-box-containing protein
MEVLVIDDEPDIREVVRFVLTDAGMGVVEAANGRDAIRCATLRPVDLVILDVNLPDMSGLDVLAELRRLDAAVHVILLTAAASEADRMRGFDTGADDYMVKPFSVRELVARVSAVERRLAADHARATAALASAGATAVVAGTIVRYADSAMVRLLGASSPSELVGRDLFDFVAPESVGATMARFEAAAGGGWPRPELLAVRRIDGEAILVEVSSTPVSWAGRSASQLTLRERTGGAADLRRLAGGIGTPTNDAVVVTGADRVVQSCNAAAEALYGRPEHEVIGRDVLDVITCVDEREQAALLRGLANEARWRGQVVSRCRDGSTARLHTSVTLLRGRGGDPVGMIWVQRPAEHSNGSNGSRGANGTNGRAAGRGSVDALDEEIRGGIERGEFVVHYQPVVRLADGEALGAEALARWQHPERGLVAPAGFIAAAERSGAIVDLGQAVLERACRQWQAWRVEGRDLHIAVNLSGRQLADGSLAGRLARIIDASSIPPGALWLEVTETSLVDDLGRARDVLHQVTELGAVVSIDDFGTGWASLTYLREFPVHAIKIDRVFVEGLGNGGRDAAIVSSMISLGRDLDLAVVAEGIESADQRDRLLEAGCEMGQGFFFGRPAAAEAVAPAVARHGHR